MLLATIMEAIKSLIPLLVLISQILLVIAFVAVLNRRTWGEKTYRFLGRNGIALGFIVSLGAILGSLFYSNIVGFEPCELCWWQRTFLAPEVLILAIAWWKNDRRVYRYIVPLATVALLIGFYQVFSSLTGFSVLSCTAAGTGACSKIYVNAFGYITIPVMSITVALWMMLISLTQRTHKKHEDRNA
jgi:disulfide bond formation protein DsbB